MLNTRITEMLGIDYPIVGGAMMYVSRHELVAAVSAAGGLGLLASANYKDLEEFRATLKNIQDATDKPFGVNLNMFPAIQPMDNNLYLDVMEQEGVKIVETSGHKAPEDLVGRIKAAGMTLIHKCVAPRYAKKAESIGVDAVTVVGYENGGATGVLDITTLVLVPRTVDTVSIPVIGGGGVGDGRGLAAMLALGAEGTILGTVLMAAEEAGLHPRVREELIRRIESETTLVFRSLGNTHRVIKTEASAKVQEMEARNAGLEELLTVIKGENTKRLLEQGDVDNGILYAGQSVGFIGQVRPAADIIQEMVEQARTVLGRLEGVFATK